MKRKEVKRTREKFHIEEERTKVMEECKYMRCVLHEHLECREMIQVEDPKCPVEGLQSHD